MLFRTLLIFFFLTVVSLETPASSFFQFGDIIFHKSQSPQSKAIQEATGSEWSHVGILVPRGSQWYVAEAVQPVKYTPLHKWVARGKDKEVRIFRNTKLTSQAIPKLQKNMQKYMGINYDIYFEWSDERIYCSEFIYKVFLESVGTGVGQLQKVKELKLDGPFVRELIRARLTDLGKDLNLEEDIVTPISQMLDPNLIEIFPSKSVSQSW
jgi:hypothetical protein